jgi:acyl-CoA dehydrogenase
MKRAAYDAEHEAFRSTIRSFVADEVSPYKSQWDEAGFVPKELYRKLASLGAMGFDIPEEYGGTGPASFRYQAIISEEAARAGILLAGYSVSVGIVLPYLLHLATEQQAKRWLPGCASGDTLLGIAMTEPGTGSDLAGIRTAARRAGDHYVLNGSKTFITTGSQADLVVVVARTSPAGDGDRRSGLSLLVVDHASEGFAVGRRLAKIGQKSADTCELSFSDVRVPVDNLLGEEGEAFRHLAQNLPRERLSIAVDACSFAAAAIETTLDYVSQRTIYGKPVASFQNNKFVLAECRAELTAAQSMVDRAMDLEDLGELSAADAAECKLFCTETAGRIIDRCLQLHGGYGYMLEYPIAHLYADARVMRIYGGTSEVQKTIIAKSMGL